MSHDELINIAVHEAGHVVAHARFGIEQGDATIAADDTAAGSVARSEYGMSREDAHADAVSFCAGYAALVAQGHDDEAASVGCENDFAKAEAIASSWLMPNGFAQVKADAIAMMSERRNIDAVALIAKHLMAHKTLDSDYLDVLLTVADGETTDEEFAQYLRLRNWDAPSS